MRREYHRWYSNRLGREMETLVFRPDHSNGAEPVILLPTSKGRFYQNEDFGLVGAIADRIDSGRYTVVCPDGIDEESWFNRTAHPHQRLIRQEKYESFLIYEVAPMARAMANGGRLTLGGCSFGGFHSLNVGLRHPQIFQQLLSMGGSFETEEFLDGYHDERAYFLTAMQWVPNLHDWGQLEMLRRTDVVLAVGELDFCRPSNERMAAVLSAKGIRNHLAIWEKGTHDWPVWRQMIREYLPG